MNILIKILAGMSCLMGVHKYKFTNIVPFRDTSYNDNGIRSVFYTKVCARCGKHKTGSIYGCIVNSADELNVK